MLTRVSLDRLFCTVGCHPTHSSEFEEYESGPEAYYEELLSLVKKGKDLGKVVAVGEIGLGKNTIEMGVWVFVSYIRHH
jgi:TatD DNase family protein